MTKYVWVMGVAALLLVGCDAFETGSYGVLNEITFQNDSGEEVSKVVIDWEEVPITITNEPIKLDGHSRYKKKLPIRKAAERTFKFTVYLAEEGSEPIVHEEKIALDPKERKLIEVTFTSDKTFNIRQKQRNPHIR